MSKSYYNSNLLKNRDSLELYFESIKESVEVIYKTTISKNWKCYGNEDVVRELVSLRAMTNNIKLALDSYKNFLTTVDDTYTEKSAEINDALKIYGDNS